jgi:hypothetical protein
LPTCRSPPWARALDARGEIRVIQQQRLGTIGIVTVTRITVRVGDAAPVAGVRITARDFTRFVDEVELPALAHVLRVIASATIAENEEIAYRSIDGLDFSLLHDSGGAVRLFMSTRSGPSMMLDRADAKARALNVRA